MKQFLVEAFGHDERSTQFAHGGCCDSLVACDYKQPIMVAYEIRRANESLSVDHRSAVCEQSSGELHRTGCVQRHAPGDKDE